MSKWESGRGYPSIDSLKELSRYFSVSIDELISPDEVVIAADRDKREFVGRYTSLICGMLDVLLMLLLSMPAFGNGPDDPSAVSLLALSSASPWVKASFAAVVGATVLCGLCDVVDRVALGVDVRSEWAALEFTGHWASGFVPLENRLRSLG